MKEIVVVFTVIPALLYVTLGLVGLISIVYVIGIFSLCGTISYYALKGRDGKVDGKLLCTYTIAIVLFVSYIGIKLYELS